MSRRSKSEATAGPERGDAEAAPRPEPVGVVKRELTRPDGSTVVVDVPVYPPFRLEDRPTESAPEPARRRSPGPGRRRKPPRDR